MVKRTSKPVELSSGTSPMSPGKALAPTFDEHIILQPIISPVTTRDEILGQDKRQVQVVNVPKNTSAVCRKDGKVLSKFWGEEDTDATDSTIDPESDSELQRATSPTASQYLVSDTVKKGKRGRPKKQRSPKDMQNTSSEHTQTRSKKGVIKSNPKYM